MNTKEVKIVSVIFITLFVVSTVPIIAGHSQTTQAADYTADFSMTFDQQDVLFGSIDGYDTISIPDCYYLNTPGNPRLPTQQVFIALPTGIQLTSVSIDNVVTQQLPGTYSIYPAQVPRTALTSADLFTSPNIKIYSSNQIYPIAYVQSLHQTDLAGQGIAVITICPFQYRGSDHTLFLAASFTLTIMGKAGYHYGDYLSAHASEQTKNEYTSRIQSLVINPEDIVLQTAPTPQPTGVAPGDYDYVIITQPSWASNFQPLADWRTKKGMPAKIVTTDWIYNSGGYSGSNFQKIKAFIMDATSTWGAVNFLLGGDTDTIPYDTKSFYLDQYYTVATDTSYGDYDGDWTVEVNVGRATVTSTTQITTFINKIFTYEKSPPLTAYAKNALLLGFNLDGSTPEETMKSAIRTQNIPGDWTVTTVYDSQGGNHKTNAIAGVNAGQNIVNHADHANYYCLGVGSYYHGLLLEFSDVSAFTNGNKQSIMYSMGCYAGQFDTSCIAETWVQNTNGGGIAFVGNSRYGWYYPGDTSTLSSGYDRVFFQSLFNEHRYSLGDCFSDHKTSYYAGGDGYMQYIYTELTLFGDPVLQIWTDNPKTLTVTYSSTLPIGPSSFTVHVSDAGSPVSQAVVCLWKGTEVYLTGTTNANGDITFTPSPTTAGTMSVTATKHNYLPFEGTTTVEEQTLDPDQSFVTLTNTNMPFLLTCPADDGMNYQYVKVTCMNAGDNPIPGIPASAFTFTVDNSGAQWYGTFNCVFNSMDMGTNQNGEIRFIVRSSTSIIGNITIRATVQGIPLNDLDTLPCKSFDLTVDGTVGLTDFTMFGQDYSTSHWRSDFTGDGTVDLGDFVMFAQHYGHS